LRQIVDKIEVVAKSAVVRVLAEPAVEKIVAGATDNDVVAGIAQESGIVAASEVQIFEPGLQRP
jgi:hypothetical protein